MDDRERAQTWQRDGWEREPYQGYQHDEHAETIEQLGWIEVKDAVRPDGVEEGSRKFVKVNGGPYDWLWVSADSTLLSIAFRCGWCDAGVRASERR